MTLSRRKALALIGGGSILAAGAGLGVHVTRPLQTALDPWEAAGTYAEPRKRALSYAILAPNPHNRQPWMVDLSTDDEVHLYVDTTKLLPHTDPFSRQITIGLGCFLEVMRIAAAEDGYAVETELFPQGYDDSALDGRPVAICRFLTGGVADPLFAQIPHRRSYKDPFDTTRQVPETALTSLIDAAANGSEIAATVDPQDIADLRQVTRDALLIEIETPHTYKESVDLFRIGRREVDANPDGIDFTGPVFETLNTFRLFTRDQALEGQSMTYQQGLAAVLENADTAMGHLWLTTDGNSRIDQINAGRDWVRVNLAATGLGIGMQPLSQALQEYPEVASQYDAIHARLATPGQTVQMLARLGYATRPAQSPRWTLEEKIIA